MKRTLIKHASKKSKTNTIKSKSGSTLIWVLIMMLVLGILITGGLMIAQSYSTRSLNQHVEQQSYYSALSVTKSIAEWLNGTSQDNPGTKQLEYIDALKEAGNEITFDSTVDNSMGTSETTVSLEPNSQNITISTTATYNDKSSTVDCILKNSSGVIGSEGDPSEVKLIKLPKGDDPVEVSDPKESSEAAATEDDGQFFIRRNVDLNLSGSKSLKLENKISPLSNTNWKTQYYSLNVSGANSATDGYLKLINGKEGDGGFPAEDSKGNMQDRYMALYSSDTTFGDNLSSFTMYTDDSVGQSDEPPRRHIIILPKVTESVVENARTKVRTFGMKKLEDTTYKNTHIQIHDTGETAGIDDKQILLLPKGTHFENSTLYTRRNTITNIGYNVYGGFFWNNSPENSYSGESEYFGSANTNPFSLIGTDFSFDGKLIVADNDTLLRDKSTINGDIIIKSTTTDRGALLVSKDKSNGVVISGGSIYVKDGGYLELASYIAKCYNDIFVEPGGKVYVSGTKLYGNIYALKGTNDDGEPAVVEMINGSITSTMTDMNDEEAFGGIYLEGSEDGDGAKFIGTGGSASFVVHRMPGSTADTLSKYKLCDYAKKQTYTGIEPYCSCGIKVPKYGNTVNGWTIFGYSEK